MKAEKISGKDISKKIKENIKQEIENLKKKDIVPGLVVLLVGDDAASHSYVKGKTKACEKVGMFSLTEYLSKDITEEQLLGYIERYNTDDKFHGILVQLPLPDHIDENKIINAIKPEKDVDGFHPESIGRLQIGEPSFAPCTPAGVVEMLLMSDNSPEGKHVVIVGRSNIVGRPLVNLLMSKNKSGNATVTVCHSRTQNIEHHTRQADILIAAIGKPEFIKKEMVKENAVVIDVGVNRVDAPDSKKGYKLVGDVDYEAVKEVAKAITPVPGGVGPMTITMLLKNTLESAKRHFNIT